MRKEGTQKIQKISDDNFLSLKPLNSKCYLQGQIYMNFNPHALYSEEIKELSNQVDFKKSLVPTFNNDKHPFTPAFTVPAEKPTQYFPPDLNQNQSSPDSEKDQQEFLVPKPRNSSHCNTCGISYRDYLQHINCKFHIQHLRRNKFHLKTLTISKKMQRFFSLRRRNRAPLNLFFEPSEWATFPNYSRPRILQPKINIQKQKG